ncbi:MAG: tetratricopeptide repeat protein [Candidatus Thermoplasmatota archaeon]|nr:tetratricopeptide repeat protein [Candidatus Thermoplasmatota archaeon]
MGLLSKKKARKLLDEGIEFHRKGDLKSAEMRYCSSLSFDPNNAATHVNYGDLLKQTMRPKAAEVEFRKAMIMDPELSEPHASLGALYHSQNRYEEAEKEYRNAIDRNPGNLNVKLNLAQLYMDTVRFTEMKKIYEGILPYITDPRLKQMITDRLR